jgi:serine/threonine protein kinase
MCTLHDVRSRLHNDIDARNIMVLKSGEVRLGGFAYSVRHVGKKSKFSGPYVHMSPERLLGLECSFPSDVWSLGMLTLELALGRCWYNMDKFNGTNSLFDFKRMVVAEPSPTLKGMTGCSDELRNFVDKCLHKNVRARLTPAELLEHPFIQRYEGFLLPAGTWLSKKPKDEHVKAKHKSAAPP